MLTEQYELAKVEEAKETPSIKVLDVAEIPGEKILSTALVDNGRRSTRRSRVMHCLGSLRRRREIDAEDERKVFVRKVVTALKEQASGIRRKQDDGQSPAGGD